MFLEAPKSIEVIGEITNEKTALVVIDIQNDITKNYKDIIDNINKAIDMVKVNKWHIVYIKNLGITFLYMIVNEIIVI